MSPAVHLLVRFVVPDRSPECHLRSLSRGGGQGVAAWPVTIPATRAALTSVSKGWSDHSLRVRARCDSRHPAADVRAPDHRCGTGGHRILPTKCGM